MVDVEINMVVSSGA